LKKKAGVWTEEFEEGESAIDAVIKAAKKNKADKDGRRIKVLDIEGEFEYCDIYPDKEGDNDEIALYNIIVAVVSGENTASTKRN
jgi:hypothetical protein